MKLIYKGKEFEVNAATYAEACASLGITDALGVMVGGNPRNLMDRADRDASVLTIADEEGRRIYERSACFVFILAAKRVVPAAKVRVENSFGNGVLITLRGAKVSDTLVEELEREMNTICAADLPFIRSSVSTEEAMEYFRAAGETDKVELLAFRRKPTFTLYECGGMKDYFYGEMAASTAAVKVFGLTRVGDSVILRRQDAQTGLAAAYKPMPQLLETFKESNRWGRILEVENAADLNKLILNGNLREFIRVNEALMDMRINRIADEIVQRGARLILIAGPSSSGKTTFCNRLAIALRVHGEKPVKLSLDDYYRNRDECPRDENGEVDLECVEALDVPLIDEQLSRILKGETVDMPTFDFKTGRRSSVTHPVRVDTDAPILIEGIHGLNDALTASIPAEQKFKIYISALTNLNIDDHNRIRTTEARLVRRCVRDAAFRGTPVNDTLSMWESVRRGEEKNIFPFQEQADVMINSCTVYELAIMKKYIYDELQKITPENPNYSLARRIVKFLNYIESADAEDEIPLNSLVREFVGGSCFYRDEE